MKIEVLEISGGEWGLFIYGEVFAKSKHRFDVDSAKMILQNKLRG